MIQKHIALINPKTVNKYYHLNLGGLDKIFSWFFRKFYDKEFEIPSHSYCTTMPPVTLYALESLFGDRCRFTVIDEQVDAIDYNLDADLVCLTATTPQIPRAFDIARRFRARGIPTAVGGVHATCLPDECARHFDVVCVGEAEGYCARRGFLTPSTSSTEGLPSSPAKLYATGCRRRPSVRQTAGSETRAERGRESEAGIRRVTNRSKSPDPRKRISESLRRHEYCEANAKFSARVNMGCMVRLFFSENRAADCRLLPLRLQRRDEFVHAFFRVAEKHHAFLVEI